MKALAILVPLALVVVIAVSVATVPGTVAQVEPPTCVVCHEKVNPGIVKQWRMSKHAEGDLASVGCAMCHGTAHQNNDDSDKAKMPSPAVCGKCHEEKVKQFANGKHALAVPVHLAGEQSLEETLSLAALGLHPLLFTLLLIGVALGNIAWGIPLDADHEFAGTFMGLLHPYALLVGVTTVALFMMHGAIYLAMKTEGELQAQIRSWINKTIIAFIICYVATTAATLLYIPHMLAPFRAYPVLLVLPVLNLLAIANIPREVHHGRDFRAFLSSCAALAALLALFGVGIYPNLILSQPAVANSLTIYNAASSPKTLQIMLIVALLGMPLVIAYTISIYTIDWAEGESVELEDVDAKN